MGRVVGVDVGSVRIGVAVSDPARTVATPLATVPAQPREAALAAVADAARRYDAVAVVVGLPLELSGVEGHAARRIRAWTELLGARLVCPVHFWDERLTSVSAERTLIEAKVGRAQRKRVIDQAAATMILQGWLDLHGRQG